MVGEAVTTGSSSMRWSTACARAAVGATCPSGSGPGTRFPCWAKAGVGQALFEAVEEPDYAWVLVDSTTVKAHKAAAGQKKHKPRAACNLPQCCSCLLAPCTGQL